MGKPCLPWWRPKWLARIDERPIYRVLYLDSQWSMAMRYVACEDYVNIFGGEIRPASEFPERCDLCNEEAYPCEDHSCNPKKS